MGLWCTPKLLFQNSTAACSFACAPAHKRNVHACYAGTCSLVGGSGAGAGVATGSDCQTVSSAATPGDCCAACTGNCYAFQHVAKGARPPQTAWLACSRCGAAATWRARAPMSQRPGKAFSVHQRLGTCEASSAALCLRILATG